MTPTVLGDADLRPVPATWCYRCGMDRCGEGHGGPGCGSWLAEPTAPADVAWSAYFRAIESLVGDRSSSEASPEVLDLVAQHLTDRARLNRARQGDRPQQAADR